MAGDKTSRVSSGKVGGLTGIEGERGDSCVSARTCLSPLLPTMTGDTTVWSDSRHREADERVGSVLLHLGFRRKDSNLTRVQAPRGKGKARPLWPGCV